MAIDTTRSDRMLAPFPTASLDEELSNRHAKPGRRGKPLFSKADAQLVAVGGAFTVPQTRTHAALGTEQNQRLAQPCTFARIDAIRPDSRIASISIRCERPAMKVRDVIHMLQNDGWFEARTRGSHRQFKHATKSGRVTVPGKHNADLAPGTLNSILKQAGLKRRG